MSDTIPDAHRAPVTPLDRAALPRDSAELARFLLGKVLVREVAGIEMTGWIVETEAYHQDDPACHAYRGITARNRSLFLDIGFAYVYLCYGTSFLLNVSSDGAGIGAGVLLRALQPRSGIEDMRRGREAIAPKDIVRGPGRLTAALRIDRRHDGLDLCRPGELWLGSDAGAAPSVGMSTRIGLTKGADATLRYFIDGSPYLSGPRRLNAPST